MKVCKGFTLVELMIVVAIIAILAGVGYPSYQNSIEKGRRTDATSALLDAAGRQEVFYAQNNGYTDDIDELNGNASPEGFYTLAVTRPCGEDSCYTLTATAVGSQLNDEVCRSFTITHTSARSALSAASVDTTDECW